MFNKLLQLNAEVMNAFEHKQPVVVLESCFISHGLPCPDNLYVANTVEDHIRDLGAVPAIIALVYQKQSE